MLRTVSLFINANSYHFTVKLCTICEYIFFNLFFYFWLHWVFIAVCRLSLVAASGGYSSLQCTGFSLRWLLCCGARPLGTWVSVVVALGLSSCGSQALEHRLSSCGARAQLLCNMWDLPRPGLEPASPALVGGFFFFLINFIYLYIHSFIHSFLNIHVTCFCF